jgi:hypothetical protein
MTATVAVLLRTGTLSATPTVTQVIDVAGDGQGHGLESPWGIVADSAGNVFVAAFVSNDVLRRPPDGTITAVIDATGDGLGHTLQVANELAIGADGSVYVTGVGSKNVFERTPSGAITQIIDATGDGADHALRYPLQCGPHGACVPEAERSACCPMNSWRPFAISSCPAGEM